MRYNQTSTFMFQVSGNYYISKKLRRLLKILSDMFDLMPEPNTPLDPSAKNFNGANFFFFFFLIFKQTF